MIIQSSPERAIRLQTGDSIVCDELLIYDFNWQENDMIIRVNRNSYNVQELNHSRERQRADNAESQLRDMFAIPEIKEIWDTIQQGKKAFWQKVDQWIGEAKSAIYDFAKNHSHHDFLQEQRNIISQGIIGEALRNNLDASNTEQRMKATNSLLDEISWTGTTDYLSDLTMKRTRQLCGEMSVTKELVQGLLLAAGGRGMVSFCGGGSDNALTNWDGTKKKTGWGVN